MTPSVDGALALDIRGLTKSYRIGHIFQKKRLVLDGLTLQVRKGEIFGYLGPNGSGKTTTLKLVTGLLYPDAGEVFVLGRPHDDRAWRYQVGYLPEHPYLYDYLTPTEYLDYAGRLFALPAAERRERARALLDRLGLARSAHVPMRRFSKGMVQRAGVAQALMNDPELVILDEPMSGLDPIGRRLIRTLITELKEKGRTVLFSTHILSDAETLCDRVAVLREGRLLDVGPLGQILNVDVAHMEVLVTRLDAATLAVPGIAAREPLGERWRLQVEEAALGKVVSAVEGAGGRILAVQPVRQSLEDYFFKELGGVPEAGKWKPED
jgi:ABC-2 type transport system ATP-binding protein